MLQVKIQTMMALRGLADVRDPTLDNKQKKNEKKHLSLTTKLFIFIW